MAGCASDILNKRRKNIMSIIIRSVAVIMVVVTLCVFASSCGTVRGVGQDVSTAGRDIQRAAS